MPCFVSTDRIGGFYRSLFCPLERRVDDRAHLTSELTACKAERVALMTVVNSGAYVKEKEKADGLEVEYLGKGFDGTKLSALNLTRNISMVFIAREKVFESVF